MERLNKFEDYRCLLVIPQEFQRVRWKHFVELRLEDTQESKVLQYGVKYGNFGLLDIRYERP